MAMIDRTLYIKLSGGQDSNLYGVMTLRLLSPKAASFPHLAPYCKLTSLAYTRYPGHVIAL